MKIQSETEVHDTHEHHRQIIDAIPDGLFLVAIAAEGHFHLLEINPAFAMLAGVTRTRCMGMLIDDIVASPLATEISNACRRCIASGILSDGLFELAQSNGQRVYQLTLIPLRDPIGRISRITGIVRDITQAQQLEAALHARAEEFHALVDNAPDCICRYDIEGRILYINSTVEQLGTTSSEQLRGRNSLEISPDTPSARRFHQCVLEVARTGVPVEIEQIIESFAQDRIPLYHVRFVPERDQHGKVVSVLAIGRDITNVKVTEEKLRALARRLSLATEAAKLGIATLDLENNSVMWDDRMQEIYGYRPGEMPITHDLWTDAPHPEDAPRIAALWHAAIAGQADFATEFRIAYPDGQLHWLEARAVMEFDGPKVIRATVVTRDITERKQTELERLQLEAQLRQAQKLKAIGTLAGGIAHDFNNILAAIGGNAELIRQDLDVAHPAQASVIEICKAAQRAKELVQRLLAFGRPQDQRHQCLQLRTVTEEVLRLLRPTIPASIELIFSERGDVPPVLIDATQISQVLMNLFMNAAQAMVAKKGHIEVEIGVRDIDGNKLAASLPTGRYVTLTVRDDGSGMTPETLEHVFEPFYTTKPLGEGSGLGLAVVHGIVRAHSGAITVQSESGHGTTFEVYLPALPPETRTDTFEGTHNKPVTRGTGQRIIYIDDEEPLVFLAQRLFQRLGYRAEGFTDATAAIEAFRADPTVYDLVVTDLSMPGVSGMDVAKALFAIDPTARVVLASGYVRPTDVEQAQSLGIRDVILKPNTVEELAAVVHCVLSEPKREAPVISNCKHDIKPR